MPVRDLMAEDLKVLGTATASHNADGSTNLDFGTPNDLDLASLGDYEGGDRVLVVFSASTGGTTDTVSFGVQDAPDDGGSIGTPAAAETDGDLDGGTGDQFAHTAVRLKSGRPWLRCVVSADGNTDTFAVHCQVFALPRGTL